MTKRPPWVLIGFLGYAVFYAVNSNAHTNEEAFNNSEVLFGIDISHYQGDINWSQVAQQNLHFVFIKASQGRSTVDNQYHRNWRNSRGLSLLRGVYHYFDPAIDALDQAAHFIATTGGDFGDFPPVVDIEAFEKQSTREVIQSLTLFLNAIEKQFLCRPIIYTSPSFWAQLNGHDFGRYKLWLAHYAEQPSVPKGWKVWTFWQFKSNAVVPGVSGNVDLNQFNGSVDELKAFAC